MNITLKSLEEAFAADPSEMTPEEYSKVAEARRDFISQIAGTGEPYDDQVAEEHGSDYLCALDDGAVVYWGAAPRVAPYRPGIHSSAVRELHVRNAGGVIATFEP